MTPTAVPEVRSASRRPPSAVLSTAFGSAVFSTSYGTSHGIPRGCRLPERSGSAGTHASVSRTATRATIQWASFGKRSPMASTLFRSLWS
ncbi:hypothetical protein RKD26_004758 [Streptomyces calvus]